MTEEGLAWVRQAGGGFYACCGEEGQGRAMVLRFRGGWVWVVDMLPGDVEYQIAGQETYRDAEDAKRDAERQVAEWPAVIEGARRA